MERRSKYVAALLVGLALLFVSSGIRAGVDPDGDVNCDGTTNSIDAAIVLQFVAGLTTSLPCPDAADVNADGRTDTVDATLILQHSAGLFDDLKCSDASDVNRDAVVDSADAQLILSLTSGLIEYFE